MGHRQYVFLFLIILLTIPTITLGQDYTDEDNTFSLLKVIPVNGVSYIGESNGMIFMDNGYIVALSTTLDQPLWSFPYKSDKFITPYYSYSTNTVYIASHYHFIYVVDSLTGTLKHRFRSGHWHISTPVVLDNNIYTCAAFSNVVKYGSDSNEKYKDKKLQENCWNVFTYKNNLYVVSNNLYIFNSELNRTIWKHNILPIGPVIRDNIAIFTSRTNYFMALNLDKKRTVWQKNYDSDLIVQPLLYKNLVISFDKNRTLRSHNIKTGELLLEKTLDFDITPYIEYEDRVNGYIPKITILNDTIFYITKDNKLIGIKIPSGKLIFKSNEKVKYLSQPVVSNNKLYALGYEGLFGGPRNIYVFTYPTSGN